MKLVPVSVFLFCAIFSVICGKAPKTKTEKCRLCTDLIDNFIKGLRRTSKGNFGGGNTDWEDRKLGNYLKSETRFEEIIETICSEFECHRMLEEQEDNLLKWFKNKQNRIEKELFIELCTNELQLCCPKDTFGPECGQCPTNLGLTCSGNGNCQGEGTREGSGACLCHNGYKGDLCQECISNFYVEEKNDSYIKCAECHKSCLNCSGAGPESCLTCRSGWSLNEETRLCDDVNECLVKESPCGGREFCENSDGSYVCHECDRACASCTGRGAEKCIECNSGFKLSQKENLHTLCEDVNECETVPEICPEHHKCVNKPGSYECLGLNNNKKDKQANLEANLEREKSAFMKRCLIVASTLLCIFSAYFSHQYALMALSAGFGSLIFYLNF